MGLFSSSSKSTTDYYNATLDQYTSAYRQFAPWSFATLDPMAALVSMGDTTKLGKTGKDLGATGKEMLQGMSDQEKSELDMENAALKRIQQRRETGQFLTPQETDFINKSLDKSFEYARTTGMQDLEKFADTLAGGRGLRMSDTPVAAEALREGRNFQLGLGSERAKMGMQATMDFAKTQEAFDQGFQQFLTQMRMGRWQTRQQALFGGGLSGASQVGFHSQSKNIFSPSTMSNIGQTIGVANQFVDFAKNVGGTASGFSQGWGAPDRKSTRLNSSHQLISYAVF